eukprot:TRINITY_DN60652_c0_g1_i1.p1 TRINITY_DN60652_c0_g1~~TRINITY_DN60652_c0_g1_i1.p1  ORF type:complete len:416 (+),score=61.59 TRINITY_DN60652_c0_g1_i1:51-1250(+)
MARAAVCIVKGHTKYFINDVSKLSDVIETIESNGVGHSRPAAIGCIAELADTLLNVAAQALPDKKLRSLRDVAFHLRSSVSAENLKVIKDINTTYSLLRHCAESELHEKVQKVVFEIRQVSGQTHGEAELSTDTPRSSNSVVSNVSGCTTSCTSASTCATAIESPITPNSYYIGEDFAQAACQTDVSVGPATLAGFSAEPCTLVDAAVNNALLKLDAHVKDVKAQIDASISNLEFPSEVSSDMSANIPNHKDNTDYDAWLTAWKRRVSFVCSKAEASLDHETSMHELCEDFRCYLGYVLFKRGDIPHFMKSVPASSKTVGKDLVKLARDAKTFGGDSRINAKGAPTCSFCRWLDIRESEEYVSWQDAIEKEETLESALELIDSIMLPDSFVISQVADFG